MTEKLGVLLVDVPEPSTWEYSYIGLYDYDKETEFFIESTDTASMASRFGYKCTEEEAKKHPQFRWVSLEEL